MLDNSCTCVYTCRRLFSVLWFLRSLFVTRPLQLVEGKKNIRPMILSSKLENEKTSNVPSAWGWLDTFRAGTRRARNDPLRRRRAGQYDRRNPLTPSRCRLGHVYYQRIKISLVLIIYAFISYLFYTPSIRSLAVINSSVIRTLLHT